MPLVTRFANQGQVFKEALEPGSWLNGDLWSDTTANILKINVSGTAEEVGVSSFSASATVTYSETIGDYVTPDSATATSSAGNLIVKDTQAQTDTSTNGTTLTLSAFVVGNNSNRVLIVCAGAYNANPDISSVTFNAGAESFTRAVFTDVNGRCEIWYLINPTVTTGDVVITWASSAGSRSAGCYAFYNAHQTTVIGVTATGSGGASTTITEAITPTSPGSSIIDVFVQLGNTAGTDTLTAGWSETTTPTAFSAHGSQYDLTPTEDASNNMNWSGLESSTYSWSAIELLPALASSPASNAVDDDTATFWESAAETNPAIYEAEGENNNFVGVAIWFHANTTETSFTIRVSTDTTFTSAEDVRTILLTSITTGAYEYIRFNVAIGRYLQIRGASGSSLVLAINEIKNLVKTDSEILADLGILAISPTDTSLALDGT